MGIPGKQEIQGAGIVSGWPKAISTCVFDFSLETKINLIN